ncbi:MAG: NOL1/NOP2/sun family putative RNA methylase [Candidatus Aenigmarchaeota archaeon]|nr:NOL1/NOP2/sun family putative RNA methylase [Candidatus Aenigmarchaeota archaeon]
MKHVIPRLFRERYGKILGREKNIFIEYCQKPLRKSIRINELKADVDDVIKRLSSYGWKLEKIPWTKAGYWVTYPEGEQVGNTLEHFMGYYYVQEAASMIPPILLDPDESDKILDMAAAPGSKTSQLADTMKNNGTIIANDVSIERIKVLRFNLEKLGVMNTIISRMDGRSFSRFENKFDAVMLDAPCSSEGIIRKDWKALSKWSIRFIMGMSYLQKQLISAAVSATKKGGVIVYSTCTLAPEENEEVIDYAVKNFGLKVEKVRPKALKFRKGIREWKGKKYDKEVENALRIWPHDNDTEGFFVAKLRKV